MYGFVPEKIYNLKGSVLLSVNNSCKTREIMSLSTKNLFGLIPDMLGIGSGMAKTINCYLKVLLILTRFTEACSQSTSG
jgi:hypothetical protein